MDRFLVVTTNKKVAIPLFFSYFLVKILENAVKNHDTTLHLVPHLHLVAGAKMW